MGDENMKKSKRSLNTWESTQLTAAMVNAAEIRSQLTEFGNLQPNTLVPTGILFNIVTGYLNMYDHLEKEALIKRGTISNLTTIN